MIGAKTVTTLLLVLAGAWVVGFSDRVGAFELRHLDAYAAFGAATLASLVGTLTYRFWRLYEPSARAFSVSRRGRLWHDEAPFLATRAFAVVLGPNHGEAFDLPPRVHHAAFVLLALFLGLLGFDSRAVQLALDLPARWSVGGAGFCPDTNTEEVVKEVEDPGCALIRRAHALGYAKDLGPCEVTSKAEVEPCTLRQQDEPLLHYAWRKLERSASDVVVLAGGATWRASWRDFTTRVSNADEAFSAQADVVAARARAAHHLYTNLPSPGGFGSSLVVTPCAERYRALPPGPAPSEAGESAALEHVLGQLLFETRFLPPAGDCRELVVHWGAAPDTCRTLSADPAPFMDASVLRVVERAGRAKVKPRQAVLSFQCFMRLEGGDGRVVSRQVEIGGLRAEVRELRAGPSSRFSLYDEVSRLLAPGFGYHALFSDADALSRQEAREGAAELYLTRLDHLADLDVYLDDAWAEGRDDLLEVYPFHLHQENFVTQFRRHYQRTRGRL